VVKVCSFCNLIRFGVPFFYVISNYFTLFTSDDVGRDSTVGIAMASGWTVGGLNNDRDKIFGTSPERHWSPPNSPYNGYHVYFAGVKRQGRGVVPHFIYSRG
jgi:hypothetical protein